MEEEVKETKTAQNTLSNFQKVFKTSSYICLESVFMNSVISPTEQPQDKNPE